MNPFDYFSDIYCINLDSRPDRWQNVSQEFKSIDIFHRVKRFSAIKHDDGRIGCIQSHLSILKISKEKNLDNVLILEDDVHFINQPLISLNKAISQIDIPWYLLYLGANTHCKLNKIKPNLLQLKTGYSTHAIAYNKLSYDKIIDDLCKINKISCMSDILDVYLSDKIQPHHLCLLLNPIIATQSSGFSDIEKRVVDYSFIEERFKNNS